MDAHAPETERSSFGADRLRLLAELEGSHFWFAGRRAPERIVDYVRATSRPGRRLSFCTIYRTAG